MASLASEGADVQGLFNRVAPRYDAANRVMSAGVDVLWRRKAIGRLLEGMPVEARFLDLGAGTLDGAIEIARRAPQARVTGADFAREMLRVGRQKLPPETRIATHAADGHHLPYRNNAFDGAFSAFCVRNLADLARGMRELRRVVRPGGRVVILEFFRPEKARFFFDKIYNAHVLPLLGWAVTGDRAAYRYLPASIEKFASLGEFGDVLRAAGFATVEGKPLFPSGVASMVVAS
ncbi:MAG TPA: ubiquinone/menaquinone biosynthesis methyltransferase [Polyangia bacterium]|nr:ubiquinone/menaquinone biosynthesis methyltransferase [Polyangia bacterium]